MTPRLYVDLPLQTRAVLPLPERAAHHVATVLRARVGDALTLFNGAGGEFSARLVAVEKRHASAELIAQLPVEREAGIAITLAQGLPQGDKMDWVVQKAVELGVARIAPVETATGLVRLKGERAEKREQHLRQVAIAACEQSGRNRLPEVLPVQTLTAFLSASRNDPTAKVLLDPITTMHFTNWLADHRPGNLTLLVGPESGLNAAERALAQQQGFVPLSLGARVLRTETAGLAAIATALSICNAW